MRKKSDKHSQEIDRERGRAIEEDTERCYNVVNVPSEQSNYKKFDMTKQNKNLDISKDRNLARERIWNIDKYTERKKRGKGKS